MVNIYTSLKATVQYTVYQSSLTQASHYTTYGLKPFICKDPLYLKYILPSRNNLFRKQTEHNDRVHLTQIQTNTSPKRSQNPDKLNLLLTIKSGRTQKHTS